MLSSYISLLCPKAVPNPQRPGEPGCWMFIYYLLISKCVNLWAIWLIFPVYTSKINCQLLDYRSCKRHVCQCQVVFFYQIILSPCYGIRAVIHRFSPVTTIPLILARSWKHLDQHILSQTIAYTGWIVIDFAIIRSNVEEYRPIDLNNLSVFYPELILLLCLNIRWSFENLGNNNLILRAVEPVELFLSIGRPCKIRLHLCSLWTRVGSTGSLWIRSNPVVQFVAPKS